ncbi:uncharacterized protein LOC125229350 [Leguminivora glycinivorella]|uniref:uncharacterized protein LOC125229350 n=1 Tax=Leguminivora glycinivorella TaxID=1035111 RepID=UPI00200D0146|nr:uncharacterized protein LOC125229350 [Leguminivora glycinivorella]
MLQHHLFPRKGHWDDSHLLARRYLSKRPPTLVRLWSPASREESPLAPSDLLLGCLPAPLVEGPAPTCASLFSRAFARLFFLLVGATPPPDCASAPWGAVASSMAPGAAPPEFGSGASLPQLAVAPRPIPPAPALDASPPSLRTSTCCRCQRSWICHRQPHYSLVQQPLRYAPSPHPVRVRRPLPRRYRTRQLTGSNLGKEHNQFCLGDLCNLCYSRDHPPCQLPDR